MILLVESALVTKGVHVREIKIRTNEGLPRKFLKHAPSTVGDFFVHATGLLGIDLSLTELLLSSVET